MIKQYTNQDPVEIKKDYAETLAELITFCNKYNVKISKVMFVLDGFQVLFDGVEGDAVIHDCSYGHNNKMWETYKFPWDCGDVSVISSEMLVKRIKAIWDGKNWEEV